MTRRGSRSPVSSSAAEAKRGTAPELIPLSLLRSSVFIASEHTARERRGGGAPRELLRQESDHLPLELLRIRQHAVTILELGGVDPLVRMLPRHGAEVIPRHAERCVGHRMERAWCIALEDALHEITIKLPPIRPPDQRIEMQPDSPAARLKPLDRIEPSSEGRHPMLHLLADRLGRDAERDDDAIERLAIEEPAYLDALRPQLEPRSRDRSEHVEKMIRESGERLEREAVRVIAGIEHRLDPIASGVARTLLDRAREILEVDEDHEVRRAEHPLEEAIAAVENTVVRVRKIILVRPPAPVTRRRGQ